MRGVILLLAAAAAALGLSALSAGRGESVVLASAGKRPRGGAVKQQLPSSFELQRMVSKALRLEAEARRWMAQGAIKGAPCTSLACGAHKNRKTDDNMEAYGAHGTIPPRVAEAWRREFEAKGGFGTPDGKMYDPTGSAVWGSGASQGWNPEGHADPFGSGGDWVNPKRWAAQRKVSGREAAEHGIGEGPFSMAWPRGAATGEADMPWSAPYEWGNNGPDVARLLRAVHERYDDPTRSPFVDRMYHKLRADEFGPLDGLHAAVEGLDYDASTALEGVERAYAKPLA